MIQWQWCNVIRVVNKRQIHSKIWLNPIYSFVKKIARILLFVRLSRGCHVSSFRLIPDSKLSYTHTMAHSNWHDYLNLASFFASVLGLFVLLNQKQTQTEDSEIADEVLFSMAFAYWIVQCIAIGAQKWVCPDWTTCLLSLKWTAVISYLLTFSCALSLPLHRIASNQRQAE